jgi:hypothetical protein
MDDGLVREPGQTKSLHNRGREFDGRLAASFNTELQLAFAVEPPTSASTST